MSIKRALAIGAVGLGIFGGVFGLAASLGVSSSSLGAGSTTVVACQGGTLDLSYATAYNATATPGYRATVVTVGNLDTSGSACGGKAIKITLTGPGGSAASLGEQTGTVPSSGTSMNLTFTGINASDVTGAHVTIAG
jgi:hypothetical protein